MGTRPSCISPRLGGVPPSSPTKQLARTLVEEGVGSGRGRTTGGLHGTWVLQQGQPWSCPSGRRRSNPATDLRQQTTRFQHHHRNITNLPPPTSCAVVSSIFGSSECEMKPFVAPRIGSRSFEASERGRASGAPFEKARHPGKARKQASKVGPRRSSPAAQARLQTLPTVREGRAINRKPEAQPQTQRRVHVWAAGTLESEKSPVIVRFCP